MIGPNTHARRVMTAVCSKHGRTEVARLASGQLVPGCSCGMPKGWKGDAGDAARRILAPSVPAGGSSLERAFDAAREAAGIPPHDAAEYVFAPPRKFRADRAWLGARVLVELHGGVWSGGAHGQGWGIERDCEKARVAAAGGWRVFPVTTKALKEDRAAVFEQLRAALAAGGANVVR